MLTTASVQICSVKYVMQYVSSSDSKLVCHSYNSRKSDYRSFCETDGGFCYWMLRRNETGNITLWKQGCSNTCEPEDRNRLTKRCCKTSQCNVFPDDQLTISPVVATTSSSSFSSQTSPPSQVSSGLKKLLHDTSSSYD